MLMILETRWRGRWMLYHTYWLTLDLERELTWHREQNNAYRVRDGDSGKIIAEWYPPGYRHNPRNNYREAHPESDIAKKRFPESRWRARR